jgi:hypothetical protein
MHTKASELESLKEVKIKCTKQCFDILLFY